MTQPTDMARQYLLQQVANASPAEQVLLLLDGAVKFLLKARACIEAKDIAGRYNNNKRAMEIVGHLSDSLNMEQGGAVAARLHMIYLKLGQRMVEIDIQNSVQVVDEVVDNIRRLRTAWGEAVRAETTRPAAADAQAGAATPPKTHAFPAPTTTNEAGEAAGMPRRNATA